MKHIEKITVIMFFAIITSLSILNILSGEVVFSQNENRVLTTINDIKEIDIFEGKIDEEVEKNLSDQFVFRDSFISINTYVERLMGYFEVNNVYFGEEGYLFNKYDYVNMKYLNGNIKSLNEFSLDKNINFMLVPSSSGVVNNMPKHAYSVDEEALIQDIYAKLNTNNIDVFNKLKDKNDIYFKLDHHWNHNGAYIGYKTIIESLLNKEPKEFEYELISTDFKGTTYSKSGAFWLKGEDLYKIKLNNKTKYVYIDNEKYESIYSESKLNTKDKYAYYLDGNHAIVTIDTDVDNHKDLLLIKDSYAHILVPYLISEYDYINIIDLRYYNGDINKFIDANTDVLFVYSLDSFVNDTNFYKLK